MNPLRLLRTSTFQLAWWYMGVFGASALVLIGYIYLTTLSQLGQQNDAVVQARILSLVSELGRRGDGDLQALIALHSRSNIDPSAVLLLLDPEGNPVAGTIPRWPEGQFDERGWYDFDFVARDGISAPGRGQVLAFDDGRQLLVAQDGSNILEIQRRLNRAYTLTLVLALMLALAGGLIVSLSVTRRIDVINRTSREIMTGRLQKRMPVSPVHDEFDQLSENLNQMLDRIDLLVEGVRAVADNIAHDLRTPLTRLRGRLEALVVSPQMAEVSREEVRSCLAEADQLLATFRALLRIARIEAGTHDQPATEVPLDPLLHDAWELYQAVAEEKAIELVLESGSGSVRGDRDLLFQAIANLLDNAIKYSPPGSVVEFALRREPGWLRVEVADRGPGIPPEERERALDRFYRASNAGLAPGSGLGLSLVKAIAAHHGGSVLLEDNAPGLRASLRLPVCLP
ncbi:MAG: HAMP domain-containing histidine kinase [Chromatiales bacterium]|nr:HAMP domain-containing histidine kinase [Chromatiales bacterium]